MAEKYEFNPGDMVTVKGMAGEHRVGHPIKVSIPGIDKFEFCITVREMVKFTYGKRDFYAWASDLTRVKTKGRKL